MERADIFFIYNNKADWLPRSGDAWHVIIDLEKVVGSCDCALTCSDCLEHLWTLRLFGHVSAWNTMHGPHAAYDC